MIERSPVVVDASGDNSPRNTRLLVSGDKGTGTAPCPLRRQSIAVGNVCPVDAAALGISVNTAILSVVTN